MKHGRSIDKDIPQWKLFWGIWLFWTLIGLIFSLQYYSLQNHLFGERMFSLLEGFLWLMPQWYLWALLTFPVIHLAQRFPLERPGLAKHLLYHALACVVIAFAHLLVDSFWQSVTGPLEARMVSHYDGFMVLISRKLHTNIFIYWALVVAFQSFHYYQSAKNRALEASRLETRLAVAQLEALKSKLQPHFLFNALNGISAMIHKDPLGADTMLVKLSHFLRMTLQSPQGQMTSLSQEMAMVDAYLEIEKARFGDRLAIERNFEENLEDIPVPALLLQPIVENAIHHGIEKLVGNGQLCLITKRNKERLYIEITDNGPGPSGESNGGIGLGATRARLDRIYAGNYQLTVTHSDLGTSAKLNIPLRPQATGVSP